MSTLYVDNLQPNLGSAVHAAGHVVQCVQYFDPNCVAESSSSTSLVGSSVRKTITPFYSNSLIIVQCALSMVDAQSSAFLAAEMYLNGSPMPSTGQYSLGYQAISHTRYAPMTMQGQYLCTNTTPLDFRVYYRTDGGSGRITHINSTASLTLWEIAQ